MSTHASRRKPVAVAPTRTKTPEPTREGPTVVAFMAADGRLDLDRITAGFNLTKSQLAETAGLASDTLQKSARRDAPKTQARVTEVLEILSRLEAWAGGRSQALAWYRAQPIAALDGRTAEALVKSGKASVVRDYLDHLALGGFA
jgi:lambda repressor-like predicted transcriptional regulator